MRSGRPEEWPALVVLVEEGLAGRHHLFSVTEAERALARPEEEVRFLRAPEAEALAACLASLVDADTIDAARRIVARLPPGALDAFVHLWFQLLHRCAGTPRA